MYLQALGHFLTILLLNAVGGSFGNTDFKHSSVQNVPTHNSERALLSSRSPADAAGRRNWSGGRPGADIICLHTNISQDIMNHDVSFPQRITSSSPLGAVQSRRHYPLDLHLSNLNQVLMNWRTVLRCPGGDSMRHYVASVYWRPVLQKRSWLLVGHKFRSHHLCKLCLVEDKAV